MKPSKAAKETNPNPAQPILVRKSLRLQIPLRLLAVIPFSIRTSKLLSTRPAKLVLEQNARHRVVFSQRIKGKNISTRILLLRSRSHGPRPVAKRQVDSKMSQSYGSYDLYLVAAECFANGIALAQLRKTAKTERR